MYASGSNTILGPVRCGPPISILCPEDLLHSEVWIGNVHKVDELVRIKGIPVEALNGYGQTALFVCAYCEDREMAKVLLSLGADPNMRCIGGYTASHGACWSGATRILRRLLDVGADLDIVDCWRMSPVDWVYEQADPEKQNKVFELLESVRRWTLNSSAGLGGSEDKNNIHAHQRPKIQRSRSTLAASNHNHRQHNDGHLEPHRYFNGIKLVAVKNNHNRTGTDVVDGIKNTSKRIKDIALHGSVRRRTFTDSHLAKDHVESEEEKNDIDDATDAYFASDKLRRGCALSSGAIGGAGSPKASAVGYRAAGSRMKPVWSKSQPGLHRATSDLPSYPTRYRLKCQMIENNGASANRVNIASIGVTSGTDEDNFDGNSKPADFVASADNFVRRKFTYGFQKSESNLLASAGHRNRQPQQQQLYYLRRYENPDAEKAKRFSDGRNVAQSHLHNEIQRGIESKRRPKTENAEEVDYRGLVGTAASRLDTINIGGHREYKNHTYRVSDSIQERQHRLLSATNSDPVDTRPPDAKSGPSNHHPQFAMPMSKPVLLREQSSTKASAAGATATQHKKQQPRRLEEELAFGEVQWTQAPSNSHPPLTTSTPNNPPAIRSQRFMAQQRGQRSFKFPAGAASNFDLRKKIVASNAFNGSFNSVLPPSEETSVVDGEESMDLYNTADEGVADDFPMNPTTLAPIKEPTTDASVNTGLHQDDQHLEVVQGEGPSTDQWTTAEEATENPYDHEVEEENQDEVATAWGNDEEVVQEQQSDDAAATVYETLEEGNEWAANDDEDPDNWLQEEHEEVNEGHANEGDVVAEDAVEEGESVAWNEESEPDSEPIANEQIEEEAEQDDGVPDEEAWNTVVATDDNAVEGLGNDTVEWAENDTEADENTQGQEGSVTTEVEEQETLRDAGTSGALEDLEDIYVDDDDLNESNPNMMLIRRASEADDEDDLGEMIGFPRVPFLPDHESILSMDIPSTGPTSLRSNCTDPTDTEEDDEVCGGSGTGGVPVQDDKNTVSAKAVTTAIAKRKADTFAQLTSKEELSQAKLILVNDRA